MSIKVKYEAKDGKQFDDRKEAEEWNKDNFEIWLEGNPNINAKHFWMAFENRDKDESYGTERKQAYDLLRKYWDNHVT